MKKPNTPNPMIKPALATVMTYWKSAPFILLISLNQSICYLDNIAQIPQENSDWKLSFCHIARNDKRNSIKSNSVLFSGFITMLKTKLMVLLSGLLSLRLFECESLKKMQCQKSLNQLACTRNIAKARALMAYSVDNEPTKQVLSLSKALVKLNSWVS